VPGRHGGTECPGTGICSYMSTYDEELEKLDDGLRRLKIEYDIFFSGNRKRPPDDLRSRVERIAQKLSEASDMTFSQRFRYTTLVTRFYVYRDLWRRTLQGKEQGRVRNHPAAVLRPPKAPAAASRASSAFQIAITDPALEPEKVRKLYDSLVQMNPKGAGTSAQLPFEKFCDYIASRAAGIRSKYNCSSVEFSVTLDTETVRFTARPGTPPGD